MLLLIYALVIGVIQTYAIRQMALKAQNAVDSIADGVAIYMIQNDGASYQEAYTQAEKLKKLLQSKTNIDIVDLQMDADAFEKNKIRVTLSVGQWYLPSLASIQMCIRDRERSYPKLLMKSMLLNNRKRKDCLHGCLESEDRYVIFTVFFSDTDEGTVSEKGE